MNTKTKIFYLFLAAISLFAIFGSATYYLYSLNKVGVALTVILSVVGLLLFWNTLPKNKKERSKFNWKAMPWSIPYLSFFLFSFFFLFKNVTTDAITSPWETMPSLFFASYILATASLILTIKKGSLVGLFISLHYFLSFSVLWIVFKYGYGYDPFIHQASLELIDKQGFIEPKKFLYLGQYSLEIIAHKLLFLPIDLTDKLLVPAIAALTLPKAISSLFKRLAPLSSPIIDHLALISLLILPFSIFTITVPQNLAYLFLLLSLFIGLGLKEKSGTILSALLALAAFCSHPLAGIPALTWAATLITERHIKGWKRTASLSLCVLMAVVAVPLALYASQNGQGGGSEAPTVINASNILQGLSRQEGVILNFINFFSYYQNFYLLVLFVIGLIVVVAERKKNQEMALAGTFALALLAAFIITKYFVDFSALISYERGDYLIRILTEAFLFSLPAIALLSLKIISLIERQNHFIKTSLLAFLILGIAASMYCSYPRKDNYFNSRGFSVGHGDFEAVRAIKKDAGKNTYVVLSNQQTSVAALKTFGFDHYLKKEQNDEPIYFYPIPTGGPLYQVYLNMVYDKAGRDTAKKAYELTGAGTVYFVLSKYWWGFDKIKEEAKINANNVFEVDNGNIVIIKFLY